MAGVVHAGTLRVLNRTGFRGISHASRTGAVHVVVRRNGSIRQRHRATIAAALTREPRKLLHRRHARSRIDMSRALRCVHVNAHDVGIVAQALFNEDCARVATHAADWHTKADGLAAEVVVRVCSMGRAAVFVLVRLHVWRDRRPPAPRMARRAHGRGRLGQRGHD